MASERGSETQEARTREGNGLGEVERPSKRVKLHGRAFYESIGSPKIVLAPMVEQSEFVRCNQETLSFMLPFQES